MKKLIFFMTVFLFSGLTSDELEVPNFDIPGQPELVACTPAATTFDPEDPDAKWCRDREHVFAVKVQNWGDFYAEDVIVRVKLPDELEYIPGSTELASEFTEKDGKKDKNLL